MKKNRWCVDEEARMGSATWYIRFPNVRMLDSRNLWLYVKSLLIAAEECEVMRIVETSRFFTEEYYFSAEERSESYIDFADRVMQEEGKKLYWQLDDSRVASKLCYYDLSGQVVEKEIFYPATVLRETRPELEESSCNIQFTRAIWLSVYPSHEGEIDGEEIHSYEFTANGKRYLAARLSIHVDTDIWFPLVFGALNDWPAKEQFYLRDWQEKIIDHAGRKWFDNSELAMRHTPRLNEFIRRARQLTSECGGTWEMDVGTLYSMWNEDGIVLNIEEILQHPDPMNDGNSG
jgi:hypothetical protein